MPRWARPRRRGLHSIEQVCRSVAHRLDTKHGGASSTDPTPSFATVVLQAEQTPGEQPTIALGVQPGGEEHFAKLTAQELRTLIGYANLVLEDLDTDQRGKSS